MNTLISHRFAFFLTLILGFFLVSISITHAAVTPDDPGNFITTWDTTNPGTSNDDQITIPHANGETYNYEIYWENTASSTQTGTTTVSGSNIASSPTLTFPEPGIYEVQASGTFPHIRFANSGDKDKILTVEQWGDIQWTSMSSAFQGASNLRVPATDAPDLSGVINMGNMLQGATSFNEPVNHWDVSNVQNFNGVFSGYLSTNSKLEDNVMRFNQYLGDWNTASATSLQYMFHCNHDFNQDLQTKVVNQGESNEYIAWDVSNVSGFAHMFWLASDSRCPGETNFNGDISNWNTSSASDVHAFRLMFYGADSFNQPLDTREVNVGGIEYTAWDVSGADNFQLMFEDASSFNQPLANWDVSNATRDDWGLRRMFKAATSFDQNLANWNVANIDTLDDMFLDAGLSQLNLDNTLQSWSQQSLQSNVPFHIGLKTYTQTGADALATLRDTYNWDITEQYQAEYSPSSDAILIGTAIQSPIDSGATTTEVEIRPKNNCTFIQWSDGRTDNPRQDVLTDNLFVIAELRCSSSSSGSSASGRAAALERQGKDAEAAAIRERFELDDRTTTSTPSTYQPPETLEESLTEVERLPETIDRILESNPSPETVRSLIAILLSLVESLMQLMVQGEGQEG